MMQFFKLFTILICLLFSGLPTTSRASDIIAAQPQGPSSKPTQFLMGQTHFIKRQNQALEYYRHYMGLNSPDRQQIVISEFAQQIEADEDSQLEYDARVFADARALEEISARTQLTDLFSGLHKQRKILSAQIINQKLTALFFQRSQPQDFGVNEFTRDLTFETLIDQITRLYLLNQMRLVMLAKYPADLTPITPAKKAALIEGLNWHIRGEVILILAHAQDEQTFQKLSNSLEHLEIEHRLKPNFIGLTHEQNRSAYEVALKNLRARSKPCGDLI